MSMSKRIKNVSMIMDWRLKMAYTVDSKNSGTNFFFRRKKIVWKKVFDYFST